MERHVANRKIRQILDLSQNDLAKRIGVTKAAISHYEMTGRTSRLLLQAYEGELDSEVPNCKVQKLRDFCVDLQMERYL